MANNTFLYLVRLNDNVDRHRQLKNKMRKSSDRKSLVLKVPSIANRHRYIIATTASFETKATNALVTKIHPKSYKALKLLLSKNNRKKLDKKLGDMTKEQKERFHCEQLYFS